jgi:hypothetical protein
MTLTPADAFTVLLPVATAVVGLVAGLLSPIITNYATNRAGRRDEQRTRCDFILKLFEAPDSVASLRDPNSTIRRSLLLHGKRLKDDRARQACEALVQCASNPEASIDDIRAHWSTMVEMVSRAYRRSL